MKRKIYLFILPVLFLFSCFNWANSLYYVGDTYPETSEVEVFYKATEIKKEYKVIGRLTNDPNLPVKEIQKAMIQKAKKVGADGIIFLDLYSTETPRSGDQVTMKAELFRYL